MKINALLLLLCLALVARPVSAQGQPSARLNVLVDQSGDDAVGSTLAYSIREELRRSAGYALATDRSTRVFTISLTSLDVNAPDGPKGNRAAVSYVVTMANYLPLNKKDPQTWYDIYIGSGVVIVGTNRVDQMAKSIVADLDELVQLYRKHAQP